MNNVWNLLKLRLRTFLGWTVPPCCQKFRQQFLAQISATLSKIKFFFSIFAQNWHFRFLILSGMGVRLVKNIFLVWCTLIRSKTPWQTKKSNETSPRSYKFIFVPQYGFWMKFHHKTWKPIFDWTLRFCISANIL